jgi:quercetin dioxygenase-like cupin family protein
MMYSERETIHTLRTSAPMVGRNVRQAAIFFAVTLVLFAMAVILHAGRRGMPPPTAQAAIAAASSPSVPPRPRAIAHRVSSEALPHVPGKRITTAIVEFPPGGYSPPHHHGGSVTVFVLAGAIRSQLQGEPPMVYKAGESFFEPPGIAHMLAENVSATEPARILAVLVADEDAVLTTYHE